jgi:hypothetical protein
MYSRKNKLEWYPLQALLAKSYIYESVWSLPEWSTLLHDLLIDSWRSYSQIKILGKHSSLHCPTLSDDEKS